MNAARALLHQAIESRVFPAAVAEVGDRGRPLWREAVGTLTFDDAPPVTENTIFDLASLTKPLVTTSVILQLVADGRIDPREPVATFFSEWRGEDREGVTVQDLLEHAAGVPARLVDPPPSTRREFEHEICALRLEYAPRTGSIYSDLGFILLGFLAADRGEAPLDTLFERIVQNVRTETVRPETVRLPASPSSGDMILAFEAPKPYGGNTAPTEPMPDDVRRGRRLAGEVHDNYAAALGGVAGHAGLFGTAAGVGEFARAILRGARGDTTAPIPFSPPLIARATAKSTVPGSSRALGWDTMLPTSSCGTRLSPAAFGHVGFTGTSLWIDPERDRYFILLTNRACGGGNESQIREVRRAFHDAAADV